MVTLCWTKGLPELQIRITFKLHFLLNHWSKFKIISQDYSSWCFLPKLHKWFQSTDKGAARALDKKCLQSTPPEPLVQISYNFTLMFPWWWCPLLKLHKSMVLLHCIGGPPGLKITVFKSHLLLNHWSKFHIASHECSPWCLFLNCINGFSQLNRRATWVWDKKSFKQHLLLNQGAQWLSGRVLDSRPKGRGFEPHRRHCVVVLEQDTFILA